MATVCPIASILALNLPPASAHDANLRIDMMSHDEAVKMISRSI